MRVHLRFNAASGSGGDQDAVEERLAELGAELVDAPEAERIIVWGGDGSIAPAAALAAEHGVPLGVVPAGTANDFAAATGLPEDKDAALVLAATGTDTRDLELGHLDDRPFVNTAAAGLAPAAAGRAAPFKPFLGPLAYPVGALAAALLESPLQLTIDDHFEGRAWQVTLACTGAFGGGTELDAADPSDGLLDLIVVPDRRRLDLLGVALAMRSGNLADRDDVLHVREAQFTVRGTSTFNVDGEVVDTGPVVHLTAAGCKFALVYDKRPVEG